MASIRRGPVTRFSRAGCGKSWECFPSTTERALLPGAVVDGVLVGGAGHRHVPLDRPVEGVVEPLASVGLRRGRSEEHTSELQSRLHLVCRLLLEKKNIN